MKNFISKLACFKKFLNFGRRLTADGRPLIHHSDICGGRRSAVGWHSSKFLLKQRICCLLVLLSLTTAACFSALTEDPTPIPPPPTLIQDSVTATPLTAAESQSATATAAGSAIVSATMTPLPPESPTPTPTSEPTAEPISNPPTQPLNPSSLPPTSRDLVFIGDGALKLWTHQNRQLIDLYSGGTTPDGRTADSPPVAGDITHFDISTDGNRIVAARLTRTEVVTQTAESTAEPETQTYIEHEILYLDVVSKETWMLAQNVTDLVDVTISPDQRTVAFVASGLIPIPEPFFRDFEPSYFLYTVLPPDRGEPQQIGLCESFCSNLVWHPTSELLVYADAAGIRLFNRAASRPELLFPHSAEPRTYLPRAWANNGRFLHVEEVLTEGSNQAVFDVPTQQLIPVPDTFNFSEPFPPEVFWMPDTRLLVTHAVPTQTTLELWRIDLENGIMNREESSQPSIAAGGGRHDSSRRRPFRLRPPQ